MKIKFEMNNKETAAMAVAADVNPCDIKDNDVTDKTGTTSIRVTNTGVEINMDINEKFVCAICSKMKEAITIGRAVMTLVKPFVEDMKNFIKEWSEEPTYHFDDDKKAEYQYAAITVKGNVHFAKDIPNLREVISQMNDEDLFTIDKIVDIRTGKEVDAKLISHSPVSYELPQPEIAE